MQLCNLPSSVNTISAMNTNFFYSSTAITHSPFSQQQQQQHPLEATSLPSSSSALQHSPYSSCWLCTSRFWYAAAPLDLNPTKTHFRKLFCHPSAQFRARGRLFPSQTPFTASRRAQTCLSRRSFSNLSAVVGSDIRPRHLVSKAVAETLVNQQCENGIEEQGHSAMCSNGILEHEHMAMLESLFDTNSLSFEIDDLQINSDGEIMVDEGLLNSLCQKYDQVVAAGDLTTDSRVLVCVGNTIFADRLALASPRSVDIFHLSLDVLGRIKEDHDSFRCWHGDLADVLHGNGPYGTVYLNFLPAIAFDESQLMRTVLQSCRPGSKVVISHIMGSNHLKLQRTKGSAVLRDLPNFSQVTSYDSSLPVELRSFQDEHDLYLAILKVLNPGD